MNQYKPYNRRYDIAHRAHGMSINNASIPCSLSLVQNLLSVSASGFAEIQPAIGPRSIRSSTPRLLSGYIDRVDGDQIWISAPRDGCQMSRYMHTYIHTCSCSKTSDTWQSVGQLFCMYLRRSVLCGEITGLYCMHCTRCGVFRSAEYWSLPFWAVLIVHRKVESGDAYGVQ